MSWSIKGNYKPYNPNSKRCSLCLHEKLKMVNDPKEILLSKPSEVIFQCCHQNKYKLKTPVASQTEASHNIQVACCRCLGNTCCEDFLNS